MGTKTKLLGSVSKVLGTFFWISLTTACAYRFTGAASEIPGVSSHVATPYRIFVAIADNETNSSGMEAELPAALARVIAGLNNVRLVDSEGEANLILAPRVTGFRRGPGLGTLQGTSDTASAGGLALGAVTAREFKVVADVELDLYEVPATIPATGPAWRKVWTRRFEAEGNYDSSLRLIPSKGSSSSSIINQSRDRLLRRTLSEDIARKVREQVFQGF